MPIEEQQITSKQHTIPNEFMCKRSFYVIVLVVFLGFVLGASILVRIPTVSVVGNSTTVRAPAPDIKWFHNWGMAASSCNKDFVHRLNGDVIEYGSFVGWEENPDTFDWNILQDYKADYVVIKLGENATKPVLFAKYFQKLIDYFYDQGCKVLVVTQYGKNEYTLANAPVIAGAIHCQIVDINYLNDDPTMVGLYGHPNDKGMKFIADKINEYIK